MPTVESRYAEALLSAAPSPEEADGIGTALRGIAEAWKDSGELRYFMLNPIIPGNIKKETVEKINDGFSSRVFSNFLRLLVDKDRFSLISDIEREYVNLKNKWRKNLVITIYSREPLDEGQIGSISRQCQVKYGASSAETQTVVDESVLGGVMIKIGDTFIDDTLSNRLKGLLATIEI